jgi:hypothetical protein
MPRGILGITFGERFGATASGAKSSRLSRSASAADNDAWMASSISASDAAGFKRVDDSAKTGASVSAAELQAALRCLIAD